MISEDGINVSTKIIYDGTEINLRSEYLGNRARKCDPLNMNNHVIVVSVDGVYEEFDFWNSMMGNGLFDGEDDLIMAFKTICGECLDVIQDEIYDMYSDKDMLEVKEIVAAIEKTINALDRLGLAGEQTLIDICNGEFEKENDNA